MGAPKASSRHGWGRGCGGCCGHRPPSTSSSTSTGVGQGRRAAALSTGAGRTGPFPDAASHTTEGHQVASHATPADVSFPKLRSNLHDRNYVKARHSEAFSMFIVLYDHHLDLTPKGDTLYPGVAPGLFPEACLLHVSGVSLAHTAHLSGIISLAAFWVCVFSPSILSSRFLHLPVVSMQHPHS